MSTDCDCSFFENPVPIFGAELLISFYGSRRLLASPFLCLFDLFGPFNFFYLFHFLDLAYFFLGHGSVHLLP